MKRDGRMDSVDVIRLRDLEVFAHHGVYPEEKKLGQKFLISAELAVDIQVAGHSDDLSDSVDYGAVCQWISAFVKNTTFHLLEAIAEKVTRELLLHFPKIREVKLEIKKPWAPIGLPLDFVAVEIKRRWHTAYIGLGSNMGDKVAYLKDAVAMLEKDVHCQVKDVAQFVVTKPYGDVAQDDFLNSCMKLETVYRPDELLKRLHEIEKEAGRVRDVRWGPRTLDLDLLFYEDVVLESKELCIPHIELHKRSFVLEPLYEIAPFLRHPVYGRTVQEMLEALHTATK
ncbi:MAG: 2-amino-4-hydroxy-6-hydroxymethyldihydropteridine diphosphokinase [Lachnospiraceae bacterium]|nr:2-amino-4-hydroxy-6-hydroxymethyldihydropteridine diphosphokinase [Lachnospiraceae bacterium]